MKRIPNTNIWGDAFCTARVVRSQEMQDYNVKASLTL